MFLEVVVYIVALVTFWRVQSCRCPFRATQSICLFLVSVMSLWDSLAVSCDRFFVLCIINAVTQPSVFIFVWNVMLVCNIVHVFLSLKLPDVNWSIPGPSHFSCAFWFTSKKFLSHPCFIVWLYSPATETLPFSMPATNQRFYIILSCLSSLWDILRVKTTKCWTNKLFNLKIESVYSLYTVYPIYVSDKYFKRRT